MSRKILVFLMIFLLTGCAAQMAHRDGEKLIASGHVEEGIEKLHYASTREPTDAEYRRAYIVARESAVNQWLQAAWEAQRKGDEKAMEGNLQRVLSVDPGNSRVKDVRNALQREQRDKVTLEQARAARDKGDLDTARASLRALLAENPGNSAASALLEEMRDSDAPRVPAKMSEGLQKTLSLEFSEAPLKQVFDIFARTSGLNFVFDKEVNPDQKTTVYLKDTSVADAINLILLTNQLERRVLNENSILIYPSLPAKIRDYQPLKVKTFFLNNAEAKNVAETIKTIIKTKDLIVDDAQNMIIMRDTPDAIQLAEKLVALHDMPQSEVMMDLEVLEVTKTDLTALGIQWPADVALSPLSSSSSSSTVTLADLWNLHKATLQATVGSTTINANTTDSDVRLLANPRVRVRSRESAKIMIGKKLPNVTTTTTSTGVVSENVQYMDVGLKLDVQPTVSPDNEVAMKLNLEVSSVSSTTTTSAGSTVYTLGTRTASTVLRLRDGENQILAGLINDEERKSGNRIPGLGNIPLLGRLFGTESNDSEKTEIVLSITPRIIRNVPRQALAETEFDAGTELNFRNVLPAGSKPKAVPATANTPQATPAAQASGVAPAPSPAPTTAPTSTTAPVTAPADKSTVNLPAATNGKTTLAWQGPSQLKAGETVALTLEVSPGQPVLGIPYAISYDPAVFSVVSVQSGDLLKADGVASSFSSRVDREKGIITAMESRGGKVGIQTPGKLVTVTLKALKPAEKSVIAVQRFKPTTATGPSAEEISLPSTTLAVVAK